jgi:RpiR family carbohydrate utilization transcriptional regulator
MTKTPKELPPHDLLDWIASVESQFSPAEQLIADYVLTLPESVLQLSMRSLAERAGVSDGSVLRFCRLAGCKGFPAFKIAVAQSLAAHRRPPSGPLAGDVATLFEALSKEAHSCFAHLATSLDFHALELAARKLAIADRIDVFGYGASAVTAWDLQHRLARLRLPVNAASDPHLQAIRVMAMSVNSVAVFLAHGHSRILTGLARMAVDAGAITVAIASPSTPIAKTCAISIEVDAREDTHGSTPAISRLAHLLVIDTLHGRLRELRGQTTVLADGDSRMLERRLGVGF